MQETRPTSRKIVSVEDIRAVGVQCSKCNSEIYLEITSFRHGFPERCNICGDSWRQDDQRNIAVQLLRDLQNMSNPENQPVRLRLVFDEKDIP